MRRLRLIMSIAVAALAVVPALDLHRVASAADVSGGAQDGIIWAGVLAGLPPSGSGASTCAWRLAVTYDANIGSTTSISRVIGAIRYDLYDRRCGVDFAQVWIPRLSASQVARNAAVLVRGRLPAPVPSFAPGTSSMVTKLPTWFWVDPSWWTPVTATAWIPTIMGPLWSRATATPTRLTFLTQDDPEPDGTGLGSAQCDGPGSVWDASIPDETDSSCSYEFGHSSLSRPGGVFVGVVGVEWRISWTSSTGEGGSLPTHTTSTFVVSRVGEIQALVD